MKNHIELGGLNRGIQKEASAGVALTIMALIALGVAGNSIRQIISPRKK